MFHFKIYKNQSNCKEIIIFKKKILVIYINTFFFQRKYLLITQRLLWTVHRRVVLVFFSFEVIIGSELISRKLRIYWLCFSLPHFCELNSRYLLKFLFIASWAYSVNCPLGNKTDIITSAPWNKYLCTVGGMQYQGLYNKILNKRIDRC